MVMKIRRELVLEVAIRGVLWLIFMWLDSMDPFIRVIQPEEMWLYKYPLTKSYVPSSTLWPIVFGVPLICFGVHYIYHKSLIALQEELLGLTLNFGVNGVVTQYLKVIVGRPRPDFYYRCFPDGDRDGDGDPTDCAGERWRIMDGRKSFPSGHSSFAFASLVYTALYLAGKLHFFQEGRSQSWKLIVIILPLLIAGTIAVSRTCDYHHHWQDVLVGSLLGTVTAYVGYRQYFPSPLVSSSHIPYALHHTMVNHH